MSGDPLPVLSDLTAPELELLDCARRGVTAQVSALPVHLVVVAGPEVRGRFIRELLLGRHGELDPRGVRLVGARISGELDLSHVKAVCGLYLARCTIKGSFSAIDARIPNLACIECRIDHVYANRTRIEGVLNLARTHAVNRGAFSPLLLRSAHIGALDCTDLRVHNDFGPAIDADRLHVDGDLLLRRARIHGTGGLGALRLLDAHVGGQLIATGSRMSSSSGPAFQAEGLQVDSDLQLANARFDGTGRHGAIRILAARIGDQAQLAGCVISNLSGPAIAADNISTGSSLLLTKTRIVGAGEDGALRLSGATINGQWHGNELDITNLSGPAVVADGLRVSNDLNLRNARLTGAGEDGTLRIPSASVGGQFTAEGAWVVNGSGPALTADSVHVEDNTFLSGARFTGAGPLGTARLINARLESQLTCTNVLITNKSGPGFVADRLTVGNNLTFEGARITGDGELGAFRLPAAKITGQLDLTAKRIHNARGITIVLNGARTDSPVFLPWQLVCPQPTGRSCLWPARIAVDDFTFGSLASLTWREWLHLIRFHTMWYTPSPYQKLAAAERAAGHDGNARHILITQQQDLQRRDSAAIGGRLTRFFHRSWGVLAGYGYRARRTAAALAIALLAAVTVGLLAGHITDGTHHAAERVTSFAEPAGHPCTTVELIGVGLDRGLPLSPTGVRSRCDLNTETTAGQWLTLLIWLIQAAVWGLATLALAGYTGLIRKPA
ncbi:hypothetical protein AB0J55_15050 [Amycolatopsis sp. NPDC049688]|uniref:hypothetical protein n=1 Tax=Amycolatopsis sp. NPDC049688 TaxID=3154733 RepID=UPI0034346F19